MAVRTGNGLKLLLLLSLVGCGGGGGGGQTIATHAATPPKKDYTNYYPPGTHKAPAEAVRVITAWSDALRAGHVKQAASYFDNPVLVQNASPLEKLTSRRAILEWNRELPCGAHVVKTLMGSRYVVATFVLTERPGAKQCGATGKLAATAFLLHHGRISEWRRVLVPPPLGPARNLQAGKPVS